MDATYNRHPLGLPAGSVRGLLAVMIVGLFVAVILMPSTQAVTVPLFAYPLLALLPVFVVAHGRSIGGDGAAHPLHLPRGILRLFLTGGLIAAVVWKYVNDPQVLIDRVRPTAEQLQQWPLLLAAVSCGFLLGRLCRLGPWNRSAMFQDFLAWLSLLCMFGLAAHTLLAIFVDPQIAGGLNVPKLEAALTASVAYYYGARS